MISNYIEVLQLILDQTFDSLFSAVSYERRMHRDLWRVEDMCNLKVMLLNVFADYVVSEVQTKNKMIFIYKLSN